MSVPFADHLVPDIAVRETLREELTLLKKEARRQRIHFDNGLPKNFAFFADAVGGRSQAGFVPGASFR
jgi:hypothetical protein